MTKITTDMLIKAGAKKWTSKTASGCGRETRYYFNSDDVDVYVAFDLKGKAKFVTTKNYGGVRAFTKLIKECIENGTQYSAKKEVEENVDLDSLEIKIDEFIETSGDDINSCVRIDDDTLKFSHLAIESKLYDCIYVKKDGSIQLIKLINASEKPLAPKFGTTLSDSELNEFLEKERDYGLQKTEKIIKTAHIRNIRDVIAFIMSA